MVKRTKIERIKITHDQTNLVTQMSSRSKQDLSELILASVSKLGEEYDTATDNLETDRSNHLNHFKTN